MIQLTPPGPAAWKVSVTMTECCDQHRPAHSPVVLEYLPGRSPPPAKNQHGVPQTKLTSAKYFTIIANPQYNLNLLNNMLDVDTNYGNQQRPGHDEILNTLNIHLQQYYNCREKLLRPETTSLGGCAPRTNLTKPKTPSARPVAAQVGLWPAPHEPVCRTVGTRNLPAAGFSGKTTSYPASANS